MSTRDVGSPDRQSISAIVCAHTDRRWNALVEALASLESQIRPPDETILVVDYNPALLKRARDTFKNVTIIPNTETRGLSGARNTGVSVARGDIVAFLDDDARAHPACLAELATGYDDESVVGTGGLVEPRWKDDRPVRWLPNEFYWTIGCTYKGLPTDSSVIRNPIGANMSFRREAIVHAGGFPEGLGRVGAIPFGCEETELAVLVTNALPGSKIVNVPTARVEHLVGAERTRWHYFRARCWAEGRSKAIVARDVGQDAALASERHYLRHTLPRGVVSALCSGLRGEIAGFARAATMLAGLSITVAGYVCGRLMRTSRSAAGGLV